MKRRLTVTAAAALAALTCLAAGCASKQAAVAGGPLYTAKPSIAYGTFAQQDRADLTPESPFVRLTFAGDTLFAVTDANRAYALTKTLDVRYIKPIAAAGETLRAPLSVGKDVVWPTATHLKFFNDAGDVTKTIELPYPMTSDIRLDPRGLLLAGTAATTGGRITVIDPNTAKQPIREDVLIGSVFSAPAGFQGVIYVANDAGKVYAVGPENRSLFPLPTQGFQTSRAVVADLVVDDYALYVASTDTVLYALDRTTGRIKWRFMAERPLRTSPMVTKDRVFQYVPDRGVVALNKTDGNPYRVPLWTAADATRPLATDDKFLYAVVQNGIAAIDLATGETRFTVDGKFDLFAAGPDHRVYAATRGGTVVSFARAAYAGDEDAVAITR